MDNGEISVGAISFAVCSGMIAAFWYPPDGEPERFEAGSLTSLLPMIDALRDELRNPMAVSNGRVPQLRAFMDDWSARFFPAALREQPALLPDVLVLVPHACLHDMPLHLARLSADSPPVGSRCGITYASSRTLFTRCAQRNPARRGSSAAPTHAEAGGIDVLGTMSERFAFTATGLAALVDPTEAQEGELHFPYSRLAAKAAFRGDPQPDLLCIMAHGYVDAQDHRLSGLLVGSEPGMVHRSIPLHGGRYFDFRDMPLRPFPLDLPLIQGAEVLTAAELEIDTRATLQLVALIGCSAGWGRVLHADEPASLAETFLHIGACSVVAPLWDSDIDAAEEWAWQFIQAWARGRKPKALAARHAMESLLASAHKDRPERYGVMTLRGDWV